MRFYTFLSEREHRVNGAIIKFNSLSYPDRASPHNKHLRFICGNDLVLLFVGRVIVRGLRFKFSRTRVYHFVCDVYVIRSVVSEICDLLTDKAGQFSDLLVSESEALCTSQIVSVYFLGLAVSVLCLKVFSKSTIFKTFLIKKGSMLVLRAISSIVCPFLSAL